MDVKSRVPGKMVEVKVAVGDTVATKDVLGVMEAMKMNQNIACPCDGVVKEIKFAPGDRVDAWRCDVCHRVIEKLKGASAGMLLMPPR